MQGNSSPFLNWGSWAVIFLLSQNHSAKYLSYQGDESFESPTLWNSHGTHHRLFQVPAWQGMQWTFPRFVLDYHYIFSSQFDLLTLTLHIQATIIYKLYSVLYTFQMLFSLKMHILTPVISVESNTIVFGKFVWFLYFTSHTLFLANNPLILDVYRFVAQ